MQGPATSGPDSQAAVLNSRRSVPQIEECAPTIPQAARFVSVDLLRGIIMIIMALDHASASWNAGKGLPEVALPNWSPTQYQNIAQQFTREITHLCAPGFQLLAGLGLAISVGRRRRAGAGEWKISADMIARAAVLFFCEWVLLYYVSDQVTFFFLVLCCIGSAMAIFSAARFLPSPLILLGSLTILFTAPLYAPEYNVVSPTLTAYRGLIWTGIALGGEQSFWVLYPILPWIGCFGLGWWLGERYERGRRVRPVLFIGGFTLLIAGLALRYFAGPYGDRTPGGDAGPLVASFWMLAKYPASPVFSALTLGVLLTVLALLRPLDASAKTPVAWRPVLVFGRVALFFYLTHHYLYAAYPTLTGTFRSYGLGVTYLVWLAGLLLLWPLCLAYCRLRRRYPTVLRYI